MGACRGINDLAQALEDGAIAGGDAAAAGQIGRCHAVGAANSRSDRRYAVERRPTAVPRAPCPQADPPGKLKAFVDWQHDVTVRDLRLAAREGFRSIEHVKRYTTTGHGDRPGQDLEL